MKVWESFELCLSCSGSLDATQKRSFVFGLRGGPKMSPFFAPFSTATCMTYSLPYLLLLSRYFFSGLPNVFPTIHQKNRVLLLLWIYRKQISVLGDQSLRELLQFDNPVFAFHPETVAVIFPTSSTWLGARRGNNCCRVFDRLRAFDGAQKLPKLLNATRPTKPKKSHWNLKLSYWQNAFLTNIMIQKFSLLWMFWFSNTFSRKCWPGSQLQLCFSPAFEIMHAFCPPKWACSVRHRRWKPKLEIDTRKPEWIIIISWCTTTAISHSSAAISRQRRTMDYL